MSKKVSGRRLRRLRAQTAKLKFKPWKRHGRGTIPSSFLTNDILQDMIGVPSRIALAIMRRTKGQLIEADRELGSANVDDILASSVERMQALIQMIEGARARLLIANYSFHESKESA